MEKMRKTKVASRIIAFALMFAMLVGLLPAGRQEAAAATDLRNPRIANDGTVTWDCVWFGHYPQSSDGKGGFNNDPIKWRVLSVKGDEALLLADKSLDAQRYDNAYPAHVTWQTSTIRSWLNGYGSGSNKNQEDFTNDNFIDKAFTMEEQAAINRKSIQNSKYPEYGIEGGVSTQDKVFFLSMEDAIEPAYGFPNNPNDYAQERRTLSTDYAKSKGAQTNTSLEYAGNSPWYLRSLLDDDEEDGIKVVGVSTIGVLGMVTFSYYDDDEEPGYSDFDGSFVSGERVSDRPALYLNLNTTCWSSAGTVSSEGKVNEIDMSSLLSYDQYQAKYYSREADRLLNRDMTYAQIEDNYSPTAYALNNILSFGWNKKFGFTDDAKVWETVLCDVLLRRSADESLSVNWEKNALELDKDLCELIRKNDIVDLDGALTEGNQAKLRNLAESCDEFNAFMDASGTKAVGKLLNAAGTVKEFVTNYAKYIELRKVIDTDTKVFLTQMKKTEHYQNIPAFQRALDSILQHDQINSEKLAQLVMSDMAAEKLIAKAINGSVETIVEALLPGVWKLVDFTKEATIFLMQTVCGTSELAQANVYLYMVDCIDESATEAFCAAASDCLASNGKNAYQAVNGGLQFLIDLKSYGVTVCRKWNDIIATDILTRLTTNRYTNVKRLNYDMANSHFDLKHASTKEEKKQMIEDKCAMDEKYINAILKSQAGMARLQWYGEQGGTAQETSCCVTFRVKNPDDTVTFCAEVVPKNTTARFPTVEAKSGYLHTGEWFTDEACTQVADQNARITQNAAFYTKYQKNIFFSPSQSGGIKIDSVRLPVFQNVRAKTNMATAKSVGQDIFEIPSYIEGYRVVELGDDLFVSCPEVSAVFIPGTVAKISDSAFESLPENTIYQYVKGSVAERYVQKKGYQNTEVKTELYFKSAVTNVHAGDSKTLDLVKTGSCANDAITWSSSDETVASVKDGMVSAKKSGETTIMASNGTINAECEVIVTEKAVDPGSAASGGGQSQAVTDSKSDKAKASASKTKKPKKVTLKKAKSTKRGTLKLTWKQDKKVTGYQAVVATDKKFKKNRKTAFIKKNKTVTKTFTKLKRGKTYFTKVRAYKKVGKKNVYGAYSKVKKARVK